LALDAYAYDTFPVDRIFAALPIPAGGARMKLQVEAAAAVNLDFHTSSTVYQRGVVAPGGLNPVTAVIALPSGFSILEFEYINSKWMLEVR
tara:strand:- start:2289 stop:2561 length:273 start_codon:yes stop_codon:yes gene_type:complete